MKLTLVLVLALALGAQAKCPNKCGGHGTCGEHDKCLCDPNYFGPGCGQRKCAYDKSWVTAEHGWAECSDMGECDRGSGECVCMAGYTGTACQRRTCENDCNGNGRCMTIGGTSWEAAKQTQCVCDAGYHGLACEKRLCARGDDPHTPSTTTYEVQSIDITQWTTDETRSFYLSYQEMGTTNTHDAYKTHVVPADFDAIQVKQALEALSNNRLPSVDVWKTTDDSSNTILYVRFNSTNRVGPQPKLQVHGEVCVDEGCQPYTTGLLDGWVDPDDATFLADHMFATDTSSDAEYDVCSDRGLCGDEGLCVCFEGYYGQACQYQNEVH
jgi:hypothetical protein